jgi:hypothetical protein
VKNENENEKGRRGCMCKEKKSGKERNEREGRSGSGGVRDEKKIK